MAGEGFDSDLVRELAALLEETGLTEIEYGRGDWRIRVARQGTQTVVQAAAPAGLASNGGAPAEAGGDRAADPGAVVSPMVGTVYVSPEPDADPFVRVGDRVTEGQTLFLVEAMKTFNEIRAPRAGEIAEILVDDRQPVEYGDVLVILR